jgi:hypothetical protein
MKDLRGQARVTAFLRNALAEAPQDVLKLEATHAQQGALQRSSGLHAQLGLAASELAALGLSPS